METLDEAEVRLVRSRLAHTALAQKAFGAVEPLFPDRLASAVARQYTGFGGQRKYTQLEDVAATLFYGLCMAHAFENGNKRTALVSMLVLLEKNHVLIVDADEDDLYELATRTAGHTLVEARSDEVGYISSWLRARTREMSRGQERMRFRDLRALLKQLGCEFDAPRKNFIKIRRSVDGAVYSVKTGYPNERFEVPLGELRRIRRRLRLDEGSGYDRAAFFDLETSVDAFVNEYRQLMNRLADV